MFYFHTRLPGIIYRNMLCVPVVGNHNTLVQLTAGSISPDAARPPHASQHLLPIPQQGVPGCRTHQAYFALTCRTRSIWP